MQVELSFSNNQPSDLRRQFTDLRNKLAGIASGITRDETLTEELLKFLFCKLYSEKNNIKIKDTKTLKDIFKNVTQDYKEVFKNRSKIKLDDISLNYLIQEFSEISLSKLGKNPISDLIEIFINSSIKGAEGQFFTPANAIDLILKILKPKSGSSVIDPACGCGNFLVSLLTSDFLKNRSYSVYGIEKDDFLSFVSRAYLSILEGFESNVFCHNSLVEFSDLRKATSGGIEENQFDYVITNPPYGSKIDVGDEIKKQFDLSYKWDFDKKTSNWVKTDKLISPSPQMVFLERCIQLAKPNGYIGLVLPEGMFSNPSLAYLREYVLSKCQLVAMISFPEELFKTSGKGGTHTKTCAIILKKYSSKKMEDYPVFLARAVKCGHDSRGLKTPFDDLPKIAEKYEVISKQRDYEINNLGFILNKSELKNNIWLPKYYDPFIELEAKFLSKTHELVRFGDLVEKGVLQVRTGDEVGKLAYGTGDIPFIRTSEISNWEIKTDNKHGLSDEIYEQYAKKQDVKCGDILMVRDGTYLVGSCAMVTEDDLPMVYQSHIYKIRSLDHDLIDPHLLLAIFSSPFLEKQIYAKRFTQDIIDTLGPRIHELLLPIPKNKAHKQEIISSVHKVIQSRRESRIASRALRWSVLGDKYSQSFEDLLTKM